MTSWRDEYDPAAAADALPRVLTWNEALKRGITARSIHCHVTSGRWRRLLPRTYFTGAVLGDRDRADAAVRFAGRGAAVSGAAALALRGVRGVRAPSRVLVLVPPGNRTRSSGFAQVRMTYRTLALDPTLGPPRVVPARAGADLALSLRRLDDVRTVVAALVQGNHASIAELGRELDAGPRQGSAHLRVALEEIGFGAASAPEAEAAGLLRRGGIRDFEQNVAIRLASGQVYVADLWWPQLRAILEIDSAEYHFDRVAWNATMARHLRLTTAGYSVIHQSPAALRTPARFVADVLAWLRGRERELGLPVR